MDKAWKRFERRVAERFKELDPDARRCPVADRQLTTILLHLCLMALSVSIERDYQTGLEMRGRNAGPTHQMMSRLLLCWVSMERRMIW